MKDKLPLLMKEQNITALLITGAAMHNPAMVYFTGTAHVSGADIIYRQDGEAVIFCNPMEREEAAKSGMPVHVYSEFPMEELMKETGGDYAMAEVLRYKRMLEFCQVTEGKVALYGKTDLGDAYISMQGLQAMMPRIELVGRLERDILMLARETKDADELDRIRKMAGITMQVVGNTADYLSTRAVKDNRLFEPDGSPVTIGKVKRLIDLWLVERGAENPESTIFAMGRDAGIPHSSGNPNQILTLGQPIVYDIYPCEQGGGYFYDFTRTWSLGFASDKVQAVYDQVLEVYRKLTAALKPYQLFSDYQKMACDLFHQSGHPTLIDTPHTQVGYVHSIGHGVGLNVHERPFSGMLTARDHTLLPGSVFTIEPGLYYPDDGLGVRIEDTYTILNDGTITALSDFPLDLVIPMH